MYFSHKKNEIIPACCTKKSFPFVKVFVFLFLYSTNSVEQNKFVPVIWQALSYFSQFHE